MANITRAHCETWAKSPLENPLTLRSIKRDGPKYREIKKSCDILMANQAQTKQPLVKQERGKKTDIDEEACKEWVSNPLVNPLTGRGIQAGAKVHKNLEKVCTERYGIKVPSPTSPAYAGAYNPIERSTCALIRKCNTYDVIETTGSARRNKIIDQARTCSHIKKVRTFYNQLNICEAPDHFAVKYDDKIVPLHTYFMIFNILMSHLHVLYGDCIIPGTWFVNNNNIHPYSLSSRQNHKTVPVEDWFMSKQPNKPLVDLNDILDYVTNSGKPIHFMFITSSTASNNNHAMALVFYYTDVPEGKKLMISILNPYMRHVSDSFVIVVKLMLQANMNKKHIYGIDFDTFARGESLFQFQAANQEVTTSSLDPGGYCCVWVLLMIEAMAHKHATTGEQNPSMLLSIDIPARPHEVWRKMIIDFFFTRLIDAYVLSGSLNRKYIKNLIKKNVIDIYAQQVHVDMVLDNIKQYMPRYSPTVFANILQTHRLT